MKQCVIYCRVSTDKQMETGHGIDSQEQRCKEYADKYNYAILKVFSDEGISGSLENRPAIKDLMIFLANNKGTTVILDDQKRLARDLKVYLFLKESIEKLGCHILYLNHNFDGTPEGRFVEFVLAGAAQLEREQMAIQTKQKMIARVKSGFWVFYPPVGYEYDKIDGSKQLILKHPIS